MSRVGRRIDVDVRKYVVHRHSNPDAGNLGSPEEVPVLVDLQFFIPSNGLQDVTMGNEAVTNECALCDVTNAPILTAWNVKYATGRSEQPGRSVRMRAMWLLAECCQ